MATAVALVLEALAIAFVNWILGLVVRHQEMSLGGLHPNAMAVGSWAGGAVFGLFLLWCAALVVRIAVRDEMVGRFWRIVLIVAAVVNGVVGAAVVGLVGWWAFALMTVILGLQVGTLLMYAPEDQPSGPGAGAKPEASGDAPPSAPPATA